MSDFETEEFNDLPIKQQEGREVNQLSRELSSADKAALEGKSVIRKIMQIERKKSEIEVKAWDELSEAFGEIKQCPICRGSGVKYRTEIPCEACEGKGFTKKVNMRAAELVLGPKYPKTTVNVNASLDNMSTADLLNALRGII